MALVTESAETIFAPFDIAGNPRGADMGKAQRWGMELERFVGAAATNAAIFATRAELSVALNYAANTSGYVLGDETAAYNGWYQKLGASGSGSWVRRGDLPYSWISMTDLGAGTANAIQVTSVLPTSPSVQRVVKIFETNTGAVTISENGATAKPLLTASGNAIAAGGLPAGIMVVYVDDGTAFRLLSDQASAVFLAAAEAAQEAAETAAEAAQYWAGQAALAGTVPVYTSAVAIAGSIIPELLNAFATQGYFNPGDGGEAVYRRFQPETEAAAIISQVNSVTSSTLSKQKEWAINRAIRRLKKAGLLSVGKLGALLDFGGVGLANQAAALVDWIRPTIVTPTIGGTGSPTYTAGKGFTFNGTSYVTLGVNFDAIPGVALDTAHAGVFIAGTGASDYLQNNANVILGGGSRLGMRPCNAAGAVVAAINTNTPVNIGTEVSGRGGHTVINRINASTVQAFRDGELIGSAASAVQSIPASPVILGWWSTPNLYASDTVGWMHVGGALSEADVALLYDVMAEYRHVIASGANPGGLLQSADGAWWELADGLARNPYQYGADEADDTQAFRNMCAIQQDVWVPKPKSSFKVQDEVVVLARVRGDDARINMKIVTAYSRSFDMRDKSALVGVVLDHEVLTGTSPSEGGQHCAVLLGRFHGTLTPVRDVEIDVKVNMLTLAPAAVYVIGNVKRPRISYQVEGNQINGAAFLAHWGSQIDVDGVTEHRIARPRGGYIRRGVAKSRVVAGHRGFYFSGVCDWRVDYLEAENFTACMGVAPGDKPNAMDAACYNDTVGKLLAGLSFGTVVLENPAGTACRMWGRTALVNGARWYSTDIDSQASTLIENLQIRRGPATVQAGDEAIMLDIDIGANIDIQKLNITHRPGTAAAILDVLEPLVRINGGRNIKIAGRAVGRVGTHVYAGRNIDLAICADHVSSTTEVSSASAGVWLRGEMPTATVSGAVASGATSITFATAPATHIVPGMEFDYSGTRFTFAGSLAGDNLSDTNATVAIEPAPTSIPDGASVTVLGGASNVDIHGSENGFYRGIVVSSTDVRIPHDVRIVPCITNSRDDGMEVDGGSGYHIINGLFDRNNRRNDVAGRDLRLNATCSFIHITGNRFAPSPGSRLTVNHVLANAGCSGVICRDNYGYGATGTMFSVPATGADGKANVNSNYEA